MNFLAQKGLVTTDPQTHRELLKTIWFNLYSRGMGKIGSSGFEHVFLSEVKNGTVMGLHNWIYMSEAEKAGDLDYKGWTKKIDLGNVSGDNGDLTRLFPISPFISRRDRLRKSGSRWTTWWSRRTHCSSEHRPSSSSLSTQSVSSCGLTRNVAWRTAVKISTLLLIPTVTVERI